MIEFKLPGEPVAWSRAGRGGNVTFTKPPQAAYMQALGWACKQAMQGRKPFSGPVKLSVHANYLPPASWSNKKASLARQNRWKVSKPDLDNLAKIVADALNGIAYIDDNQIVSFEASKSYGFNDHLIVWIDEL